MLKAIGILAFAVALEAGFLFTVVAPREVLAAEPDRAAEAKVERVTVAFDAPARRW